MARVDRKFADQRDFFQIYGQTFAEYIARELGRPVSSEEMERVLSEFLETRSRDWWANARASRSAFMLGMRECSSWVLNRLKRLDVGDLVASPIPPPARTARARGYFIDEEPPPAAPPQSELDRLRAVMRDVHNYLESSLSPCDADCECILHDVEDVLGLPDTRGR